MEKKISKLILSNERGMTLVEVSIAVLLFAIFSASFITGLGGNVVDSIGFKEELSLKDLAEFKINELVINPPEFQESLTSSKDSKVFEDFPEYRYSVKYTKISIPDLSKIQGQEDNEDREASQLQARLFKAIKENMEKMVWQVEVDVTHIESKRSYSLSTWLYNGEVEVNVTGF